MPLIDLRDLTLEAPIESDLCIIGSGPAGLSIAREFANTSVKVLVLESGGRTEESDTQALYDIESVGLPRVMEQRQVRNRILGGSSHTWYGRCAPLEPIDYEVRDWVPHSGWPITHKDLQEYEHRASKILGLGSNDYGEAIREQFAIGARQALNPALLRDQFWQYSKVSNRDRQVPQFGRHRIPKNASNIDILLHANVTHLSTNADGSRVESVDVTTLEGKQALVKAKLFVLCCGGIENSRLLLASNRQRTSGLGNEHDLVGRFLMDHPGAVVGEFASLPDIYQVNRHFGDRWYYNEHGKHVYDHGIALSAAIQQRESLLNCAAFLQPIEDPGEPWKAIKKARADWQSSAPAFSSVAAGVQTTLAHPGRFLKGLSRQLQDKRPPVLAACLYCLVEQQPNPNSRVTLAETKDSLGMPISQVNWQISEQEVKTVERLGELIAAEFSRLGIPQPILHKHDHPSEALRLKFRDRAHPTGTTRMSATPSTGVVDVNCKLHTVEGLYVAGTSVFPTASHVNPTLDIIALSIRLADHLKTIL
ncbi:MAG: GMC family oxidoreductase [Cyanobacteria bacterium P01_H01_bin.153]